ncbi:MAG: hypothetical protein ACRDP6_35160 [Actinoallomurus sp.]
MFHTYSALTAKTHRARWRFGSALLALSVAGCGTGPHHVAPKPPAPSHLQLPPASGTVLPAIGNAFKVQGVEAGRGISLPEYSSPSEGTTNVYVLLQVKGTFTDGSRPAPGPLDGIFGFNAPECGSDKSDTSCEGFDNPMIGGFVFLKKEDAFRNPAALLKNPVDSSKPPELNSGVPYYTLVAEAIPTNIPLKDITFCSDKKCLPLAKLPKGTL